jgi:tRNA-Thr(GGU) m(6)t(6)A37 methyltransferase TsaA
MQAITYEPIGVIHSPFTSSEGMPIQSAGAEGVRGTVEVNPAFTDGLRDLEGFSHVLLVYHFHLSEGYSLLVKPFLDDKLHGVFATRAPRRPNAIGISVVRLVGIQGARLAVEDVDVVDGTPLLDIKPYVPQFDARPAERIGWLAGKVVQVSEMRANGRFT